MLNDAYDSFRIKMAFSRIVRLSPLWFDFYSYPGMQERYLFVKGTSPLVATAIHDGHKVRDELVSSFKLDEPGRLKEEDPFTGRWTEISDNRIIVNHSRFELDINRPRDKAVYLKPDDAWGLQVWKNDLPQVTANTSLAFYDDFYKQAKDYFEDLFTMHNNIVVYDIHSYNHQRAGENQFADPAENPEINIGTKNMDDRWNPLVQDLIQNFSGFEFKGRNLDVRENIKFKGGYFGQWLYEQYGKNICPLSIEFKKFFMNECNGEPFEGDIDLIRELLQKSINPVMNRLQQIKT